MGREVGDVGGGASCCQLMREYGKSTHVISGKVMFVAVFE